MAELIGLTASIISVIQLTAQVTELTYGYISRVNRASEEKKMLASELKTLGKVLSTLKDCISTDPQPPETALAKLGGPGGPLYGCARLLEQLQAKLAPKEGKLNKLIGNLKWPLEDVETQGYISQFERHKALFSLALSVDHITLTRKIEDYSRTANGLLQDIWVTTADQDVWRQKEEVIHTRENRDRLLSWVFSENFEKISEPHRKTVEKRQKNTGKWLLETPKIRELSNKNPKSRLLWGFGIPGAGKTFLRYIALQVRNACFLMVELKTSFSYSSTVIDHFLEEDEGIHGVAYIYFEYKERERQTPMHVLESLCKQLAAQIPTLPVELEKLYQKLAPTGKRPTFEALFPILTTILQSFDKTFMVFDGLDECQTDTQRVPLLDLFLRMAESGARLFVTSRPHPEDIQEAFKDSAKIKLSAKDQDIRAFIQQKINDRPRAKRMIQQAGYQDKIIPELIDFSQGMFLLARFHIEYICQQTTARKFLNTIESIKASSAKERPLDPTYDRAMETLRNQIEDSVTLGLRVLTWLVNAKRTLTVDELQAAVCIQPNQYEIDMLDLPEKSTILDVCAGLVVIDETTNTFKLAHYTVQEYLLRNAIISEDADLILATACATFLSFNVFAEGPCTSNSSLKIRLEMYPFLEYAAPQLISHLKVCDEDLTSDMVHKFLENSDTIASYLQILHYDDEDIVFVGSYAKEGDPGSGEGQEIWNGKRLHFNRYPKERSPLHIASSLGHHAVLRLLIEPDTDISVRDSFGWTALHCAAWRGRKDVVSLLLENKASCLIQERTGDTALHIAAEHNHEAVVCLLLGAGADHSIREMHGYTPLFNAAIEDHVTVVQLLIESGADVTTRPAVSEETGLHWAAYNGHEAMGRLLLENGADVSATDKNGETALHWAASKGHEAMAKFLLENGANISAADNGGGTALHQAAGKGHEAMVKLLLENGADISATGNSRETALHWAAYNGHEMMAKLLLENGADISAADNDGNTALHTAASGGHQAMGKLLLENGADISSISNSGQTALHWAAVKGHQAMGKLLLENGADISAADNDGEPALHFAAFYGHEAMGKLLLENGADISSINNSGQTALHRVAGEGHQAMGKLLLESGADISAADNDGELALHFAAYYGHEAMAKLLLENGADITAKNNSGETVLHEASRGGHTHVVGSLLENGADISEASPRGLTTLHLAASRGHKETTKLLLEKGANISARDNTGQTALYKAADAEFEEVVVMLLENDADLSVPDELGATVLQEEAYLAKIVKLLVETRAKVSIEKYVSEAVLREAPPMQHGRMISLLKAAVEEQKTSTEESVTS